VLAALLAALAALAAGAVLAGQGGVTVWTAGRIDSPDWSQPCFHRTPRPDRPLLSPCSRVRGRVLAVRHKRVAPTQVETHLAVLAHFRLVLVKLDPGTAAPGVGRMITAVGPLVRARVGVREVQAFALSPA
jgi:hypothetical protein